MIRTALLLAALGLPASADALRQCEALVQRLPVEVAATTVIGGVCAFTDVRFGGTDTTWRAERVLLGGDIDALPDALPTRLTGGVMGLVVEPHLPGQPGLAWLIGEQAGSGTIVTFDTAADAGVLRINSFVMRTGDAGRMALTARLTGVPDIWPINPTSAAAMRIQALDLEITFDGLFETLLLMPLGTALLDTTQEAEPQIAALRSAASAFLSDLQETSQAENAAQAEVFLDALPHPRGVLEVGIGGEGLSAVQVLQFAKGIPTPDFVRRTGDAVDLDVFWTPKPR